MLLFGLLILVPTAVFATDYDVKSGSNLIFNFEQLRRDQPPQVEMRDESLGLYMQRRPQTTTTTVTPIYIPESQQMPQNIAPKLYNPTPQVNEHGYQYNPTQQTPIPVPKNQNYIQYAPWPSPPSPPQWSDLAKAFKNKGFPHYESPKPYEHSQVAPDITRVQQPPQFIPPGTLRQEQEMPAAPEFSQALHRPQMPTASMQMVNHHNDYNRNPMHQTAAPASTQNNHFKQETQHPAGRGNHKFNWNDLTTEPSWSQKLQVSSTTVRAPVAGVAGSRPIPRLSPWTDGF